MFFEEVSERCGFALMCTGAHEFVDDSLQGSTAFVAQVETRFDALHLLLKLSCEIAFLCVRADEQFTSEEMPRIAIERLVDPHDHVVVLSLIPERDGNEDVRKRRSRVAFQTLQLQVKSTRQFTQRFHQTAVMQ